MTAAALPLIVRLRNWVGDVVLGVPALQRLEQSGYTLHLIGKAWARDLLRGHGWDVQVQTRRLADRVRQLRELRRVARAADPGFDRRLNAVAFPFSFSSALEMRLAGLRAIGHAYEARGWLLARSVPRPRGLHELEVYWQLASALLGAHAPPPSAIALASADVDVRAADTLLHARGIAPGFIALCPFAGGTFEGRDKTWPEFAEFAARDLPPLGRPLVVCPGPGEEAQARERFGHAVILEGVKLGTYAALLRRAALMISNDTGPGHLAAAVGTPLVSVLGPSDPAQWRAWGPTVRLVQGTGGWPLRDGVLAATRAILDGG